MNPNPCPGGLGEVRSHPPGFLLRSRSLALFVDQRQVFTGAAQDEAVVRCPPGSGLRIAGKGEVRHAGVDQKPIIGGTPKHFGVLTGIHIREVSAFRRGFQEEHDHTDC